MVRVKKNTALSKFVWEISNVFTYYHRDSKFKYFYALSYGSDWLVIVDNHGLYLVEKVGSSFLIRLISVRLRRCRTFIITTGCIQHFSNLGTVFRVTSKPKEVFNLNVPPKMPSKTACHFQIFGEKNLILMLLSSQTAPSSLLYSRQNRKQRKHMREINNLKSRQFINHTHTHTHTHTLSLSLSLSIYIYIYINFNRTLYHVISRVSLSYS